MRMPTIQQNHTMLDESKLTLLRVLFGSDDEAVRAYNAWQKSINLNAIDGPTYRVIPLLLSTAIKSNPCNQHIKKMHGMAKYIWLSNLFRLPSFIEALKSLETAGIDTLVLKGGALFARDESLISLIVTGDYDVLVRLSEAERAITTLMASGFKPFGMRSDIFTKKDFEAIHGAAFIKGSKAENIDLHWRPLPENSDDSFVEHLFARAEKSTLNGYPVKIPSLADHLFLTVVRPRKLEMDETFNRAVEAAIILDRFSNQIDWNSFKKCALDNQRCATAKRLLGILNEHTRIQLPKNLLHWLNKQATFSECLHLNILSRPNVEQSPWGRFLLKVLDVKDVFSHHAGKNSFFHTLSQIIQFWRRDLLWPNRADELKKIWSSYLKNANDNFTETVFLEGFSFPEDSGRWTNARIAVLKLPIDKEMSNETISLCFNVLPFFPPGASSFAFDYYAGLGEKNQVFRTEQGSPVNLYLEARVEGEHLPKVVIVFRLIDAGRPLSFGVSEDSRLLGLFIKHFSLNSLINSGN